MKMFIRWKRLLLVTAVVAAELAAATVGTLWLSGRLKKPVQPIAPETSDASVIPIATGTFVDDRDGKAYKTVKMPDGKTWLAENLNYKTGESWCYDNDSSNCGKYGRMYDWETALTVCPAGWRLPTYKDWCDLERAIGGEKISGDGGTVYYRGAGKKMKAKSGWGNGGGTDDYGFAALPGGASNHCSCAHFAYIGIGCAWWTATMSKNGEVYVCGLTEDSDNLFEDRDDERNSGLSARCVQADGAHTVTVSRGGADAKNGGGHAPGETVTITAGTAPDGRRFKIWASANRDVTFADASNITTTFVMPASDVTVTALFDTVVAAAVQSGVAADGRDGQSYKTVIIGGKWWLAENLNYETPEGSRCYDDDAGNCAKYGRLYSWKAAERACLEGWRLPVSAEWDSLARAAGGRRSANYGVNSSEWRSWYGAGNTLKAKSDWDSGGGKNYNGADYYGFSALPGGYYNSDGYFADIGRFAGWWTASGPEFEHQMFGRNILYRNDVLREKIFFKELGLSVRCVRDTGGALNSKAEWEWGKIRGQSDAQKRKSVERARMKEEQRIENLSTYFTDSRDGLKYRAVKIGGLRWMAENLRYEPKSGGSWCQSDDAFFCGKYGRLYDWNAAKTACPNGWRLPTRKDWDNLAAAAGGQKEKNRGEGTVEWVGVSGKLRSKSGWDPRFSVYWTDEYGFSALPNGHRKSDGTFVHIGLDGESAWWTAAESGGKAFVRWVGYYGDSMRERKTDKSDAGPVRCVADK